MPRLSDTMEEGAADEAGVLEEILNRDDTAEVGAPIARLERTD